MLRVMLFGATYSEAAAAIELLTKPLIKGRSRTLGKCLIRGWTETLTDGTPMRVKVSCDSLRQRNASGSVCQLKRSHVSDEGSLRNKLDAKARGRRKAFDLCPDFW